MVHTITGHQDSLLRKTFQVPLFLLRRLERLFLDGVTKGLSLLLRDLDLRLLLELLVLVLQSRQGLPLLELNLVIVYGWQRLLLNLGERCLLGLAEPSDILSWQHDRRLLCALVPLQVARLLVRDVRDKVVVLLLLIQPGQH